MKCLILLDITGGIKPNVPVTTNSETTTTSYPSDIVQGEAASV